MAFWVILASTVSGLLSDNSLCPAYECEHPAVPLAPDTCIFPDNNTFYLQVCDIGQYCRLNPGFTNSSCFYPPTVLSNPPPVYVGELCSYTTGCIYGSCVNGLCRGAVVGSTCKQNAECDLGLYCFGGKCTEQIKAKQTGCRSDGDCVNSAGCNVLSGTGTCTPYFSVEEYEPVGSCAGYRNYLCESSYCLDFANGTFSCLPSLESLSKTPTDCTLDGLCRSKPTKLGSINNNCTCGYNPTGSAYCDLFLGDSHGADYLSQMKKWTKSDEILACNTDRRFEYSCLVSHMKYEQINKFGYYFNKATLFPVVQGIQNCSWYIFFLSQQQIMHEFVSAAEVMAVMWMMLVA